LDVAVVKDLEAKLLDDLKALSAAFYSHPAPTPSAPREEPVGAAPKPAAAAPPAMNRNKRSLALSLKTESARKVYSKPQPTATPVATALSPAPAVLRAERQ
jgi:hypothetical protein